MVFSILFSVIAGIFPAIFVVVASYAGCDRLLVVLCFILAYGFNGNYYPGMRVNALDLAPNYAGSIIAVTNGFGAMSGVAAPIFVGIMTPDVIQTVFNRQNIFQNWNYTDN